MQKQTLIYGGDFSIGLDSKYLDGMMPVLKCADLRIIHLEEPFLLHETEKSGPNRTVKSLKPLIGNVDMMSLCSNHFYDFGEDGVRDTIDWCRENNIPTSGGGINENEAEEPAFFEKDGVRYGLLSWNAIGPTVSFASAEKAGCAYVGFRRAYIPEDEKDWRVQNRLEYDIHSIKEPVELNCMAQAHNYIDPLSYDRIARKIYMTKQQCDVLIVYFHKGYVHRPSELADYEKLLCHIAVDNGADIVTSSHSHLARGVEIYKGKAIYHGLNAFVMWTPQLSPQFSGKIHGDGNEEWIKARLKRFGFIPDPEYPTYPFHPEGIYCMTAKAVVEDGKITQYRLIPMVVEKSGIPYPHGCDEKGNAAKEYFEKISAEEGFNTVYTWDGDELIVT